MEFKPDYSKSIYDIPGGSYLVEIVDFQNRKGRTSGAPYIRWTLRLLESEYVGANLYYNTPLAGRGAGILRAFLQAADPTYHDGEFNAEHLIGRKLHATVQCPRPVEENNYPFPSVTKVEPANRQQGGHANCDFNTSP